MTLLPGSTVPVWNLGLSACNFLSIWCSLTIKTAFYKETRLQIAIINSSIQVCSLLLKNTKMCLFFPQNGMIFVHGFDMPSEMHISYQWAVEYWGNGYSTSKRKEKANIWQLIHWKCTNRSNFTSILKLKVGRTLVCPTNMLISVTQIKPIRYPFQPNAYIFMKREGASK